MPKLNPSAVVYTTPISPGTAAMYKVECVLFFGPRILRPHADPPDDSLDQVDARPPDRWPPGRWSLLACIHGADGTASSRPPSAIITQLRYARGCRAQCLCARGACRARARDRNAFAFGGFERRSWRCVARALRHGHDPTRDPCWMPRFETPSGRPFRGRLMIARLGSLAPAFRSVDPPVFPARWGEATCLVAMRLFGVVPLGR